MEDSIHIKIANLGHNLGMDGFSPLQFYGVMGLMYLFLGITWLVMLACNWRDLLRVQFWVGGVIVLGKLIVIILGYLIVLIWKDLTLAFYDSESFITLIGFNP